VTKKKKQKKKNFVLEQLNGKKRWLMWGKKNLKKIFVCGWDCVGNKK